MNVLEHICELLEIASREIDARERILKLQQEVQSDLQRRQEIIYEQHQQNLREQQTAFREAETQLMQVLAEREGSVSRYFGQINEADSKYGNFIKKLSFFIKVP